MVIFEAALESTTRGTLSEACAARAGTVVSEIQLMFLNLGLIESRRNEKRRDTIRFMP